MKVSRGYLKECDRTPFLTSGDESFKPIGRVSQGHGWMNSMLEGCRISRAFQRIVEAAGHLRRTSCEVFPTIKAKQCSSYLVTLYMLVLLLSHSPNRITNYILWKDDKLPSKPMQSTGDSLLCLCINPRTSPWLIFLTDPTMELACPLRNLPVSLLTGEIKRGFPWLLSLAWNEQDLFYLLDKSLALSLRLKEKTLYRSITCFWFT